MENIFFSLHPDITYSATDRSLITAWNLVLVLHPIGTAVAQWLRCCATNRKVAGSIPDGVFGIFH